MTLPTSHIRHGAGCNAGGVHRARSRPRLTVLVAGLLVGAAWHAAAWLSIDRRFAFPLERPYVLLEQGRQLAHGHLPPPGSGVLWPTLLAPGGLAGGTFGELWAASLAVVLVALTAAAAYDIGARLGGGGSGRLAAALVLGNGWFLFNALSATESGPATATAVAALAALAAGRFGLALVALAGVALAAPWGAAPALAVTVAVSIEAASRGRLARLALAALPVAAAALMLRAGPLTLVEADPAASLWRVPGYTFAGKVSAWLGDTSAAASTIAVGDARYLVPVAEIALALLGGWIAWNRSRAAAILLGAAVASLFVSAGSLAGAGWALDDGRLVAPVAALIAVATGVGIAALPARARSPVSAAVAGLLVVTTAGWLGTWILQASQLARVQLPLARQAAATMGAGSRVAVDRPGVLDYIVPVTLDLSGHETAALRKPAAAGLGSVWETLQHYPVALRPDLIAVSLDRLHALRSTGILGHSFIELHIPYYEPAGPDTERVLALYALDWNAVARSGLAGADIVDVGDLASEGEAGYAATSNVRDPDIAAAVPLYTRENVSEGCRRVTRERFSVPAGTRRLAGRFVRRADIVVEAGGRTTRLVAPSAPDRFSVGRVLLPAGSRRVELHSASGTAYVSCHYWTTA